MAVTQKQSISQLTEIKTFDLAHFPGIGQKTKEKLLSYYGSEESALHAIKNGFIGCAPGFTFKQALRFSQTYFELKEGVSLSDVIKTPDLLEIFQQIKQIIAQYTQTEYSKQKLHYFIPLPSTKIHLIQERHQYFDRAIQFFNRFGAQLEAAGFSKSLQKLNILKQIESFSKIKTRICLTDSKQILQELQEKEFNSLIDMELIKLDENQDISGLFNQYSRNFNVVVYIGRNSRNIPNLPNILTFNPNQIDEASLIPERIINFFSFNKDLIQNMIKIVVMLKNTKETKLLQDFLSKIDLQTLKQIKENASVLNSNGDIRENVDATLDCYYQVYKNFDSIVSEAEGRINQEIQREIGDRSIEIQGKQILNLFRNDVTSESLRSYIPAEVDDLISEIIQNNIEFLRKELFLSSESEDYFTQLIPEFLEYPFHFEDSAILLLEKIVTARYFTHRFNIMNKIAIELEQTHHYLLELHQTLLEFEFFYAIGRFAKDYELSIPNLITDGAGLGGKNMVNLHLQQEFLSQVKSSNKNEINHPVTPVPISYIIGDSQLCSSFNSIQTSSLDSKPLYANLALLTGSNSGGKTMCLLTFAQAILLAQMGFPSIGSFIYTPFDEIYFFKKSSGQISAGAFETTLLQFVSMAQSSARKLIFADELEAITEPTAAAKVLASIFTLILSNANNFGIFVTHLGELILSELSEKDRSKIRLDGIEAKGLDENLELIVDRNPHYHYLANSTPELIIERLAKS
ncbi:MAG: hypothetical protein ACTSX0_09120, partial [Promethearchaeota archaeon]